MNKLYIIGNGFDLAHDLETRYSDFIFWYFNKSIELKNKPGTGSYSGELMNIVNDQYRLVKYDSLDSLMKDLNPRRQAFQTKSSLFEHLLTRLRDLNWVDIEIEYFRGLVDLMNNYEQQYFRSEIKAINNLRNYNANFILIKEQLIEYLQTIKTEGYNETIRDRIKDDLSSCSYNSVLFLVFNYTDIINRYKIMLNLNEAQVINIHGRLGDEGNPIIFGYGDEMNEYYGRIESLNLNEFTQNIKSFWYLGSNNLRALDSFLNADNYKVSIMGHSCGISDRVLLNSVFCHLHCKGIRIFYHKRNENENDYFEKTQEISRHFPQELKYRMRILIDPFPESKSLS